MEVIFCDIDGTLTLHNADQWEHSWEEADREGRYLLPGVKEKFDKWASEGKQVILTTGRKESQRKLTEYQLEYYNLKYDRLIMDVGHGRRYLINDQKVVVEPWQDGISAIAYCVKRDGGLKDLPI